MWKDEGIRDIFRYKSQVFGEIQFIFNEEKYFRNIFRKIFLKRKSNRKFSFLGGKISQCKRN